MIKFSLLLLFAFSNAVEGYIYERIEYSPFTVFHVLTIDIKQHLIKPVKADGRETVLALAQRNGALAAVNGGFWKHNGTPAGILKIDGLWYGTSSKTRGAIGWSHQPKKTLIDRVLTRKKGTEVEVVPLSQAIESWKMLDHIVGGAPLLVQAKKIVQDFDVEKVLDTFLLNRHARTAVGIKENGDWVLGVVDGPLFGMTIIELAQMMLDLGCTSALNLDGGSSSTMVIEGKVVNRPYGTINQDGKWMEAVSDAILIY